MQPCAASAPRCVAREGEEGPARPRLHPILPPHPQLRVDRRALGDGLPYLKLGVWSLALELAGAPEGRLQLFPSQQQQQPPQPVPATATSAAASGSGARAARSAAAAAAATGATAAGGGGAVRLLGAAEGAPAPRSAAGLALADGVTAAVRRSLTRELSLSNPHATDLTFIVDAEGPFVLESASTHAMPHPVTRLELLHDQGGGSSATGGGGKVAAAAAAAASSALAALFPPGTLATAPGAPPKRIFSLPPQATITVTVRFDPDAGHSLKASAAALFFAPTLPTVGALSATAHLTQQQPAYRRAGGGGGAKGGRASVASPADSTGGLSAASAVSAQQHAGAPPRASGRAGGGGSSPRSARGDAAVAPLSTTNVVAGALAASATHLRGDYVGRLLVTFSNGDSQEVGLRAEVLRPALVASPAIAYFGSVRVGAAVEERTVFLANPTAVDAIWTLRHAPQPPAPRRPGAEVDWRALGLKPSPLWTPQPGAPPPADDPSVWSFSAACGVLSGPTPPAELAHAAQLRATPGALAPVALRVAFAPRSAGIFVSRFRLSVRQGAAIEILLVGTGSFEEGPGATDAALVC